MLNEAYTACIFAEQPRASKPLLWQKNVSRIRPDSKIGRFSVGTWFAACGFAPLREGKEGVPRRFDPRRVVVCAVQSIDCGTARLLAGYHH